MNDVGSDKPNIWTYKTADAAATVDTSGYFSVGYGLKVGDVVLRVTVDDVTLGNSATVSTAGWHVVMTVSSTAVNVSDTTALTITNTD
jgi:hypothetical protein